MFTAEVEYVVGFLFNTEMTHVWLIRKNRPDWQRGKLNGIGGHIEDGETMLEAMRREFKEETGLTAAGSFTPLTPARQSGGKNVYAWAFEGDCDPSLIESNTFSMEWPPRSGKHREFPEIDRAGWFTVEEAREKILKGQMPFLEELQGVAED